MAYFASADELQDELAAFLERFLASEDGERASAVVAEASATLRIHTVDPDADLYVNLRDREVARASAADPDVELDVEADALHDILLERLDPVQISRLYETGRVRFAGTAEHLAGLVALAGALQPHYPASLAERGRDDLLGTPAPPTQIAWGSPDDELDPMIGRRRPWQRPKRTATPS